MAKRYKKASELVSAGQLYSLSEAAENLEKLPKAKFDETVEVAVRLGVDPKKAEENVRGTVELPHGTGKTLRVAVFCKGDKQKEAQDAGAEFVGADDLVAKVQGGWLDFDAAVATPDMMVAVGKIGKLLGPRGLMPNPKVGTVTFDVGKAVKAIKAGRVEFRVEKAGIVHVGAGKVSFGAKKIEENLTTILESIVKAKPKSSKGIYVQSIYVSSTMSPSMQINPAPFRQV
ncbi:MAG: 50S ribosomal protein L1 [Deltaproteobacteria bacterium]|nr:50S ribosomal protein L1 [Deltaproteobacteria bacterium]